MEYTQRFSEGAAVLAVINPAAYTTEQNTGYVSLANYHRAAIIIHCGTLAGNLDIDIEEATTTAGAGAQTFDAGGKDLALVGTTDNNTVSIIEIRTEECDVDDHYDCINVELTPAGQASDIFSVLVLGLEPRFKPVPTTLVDSVTD
ncbi:MAG: hypothetical protein WC998_01455 [Candidatus Paceibacterota bacterium]|jgi:hypothetical protein